MQTQKHLTLRAALLRAVRRFFEAEGYLEVETPVRIPAPAPETHIDAPAAGDWFLQTSPELCMKRLLATGWPRLFQICRCFREGERGRRHLPEMTLLEWYAAGQDYRGLMATCEKLIAAVAMDLGRGTRLHYQGRTIDLRPPWERITVSDLFARFGSMPLADAMAAERFDEILGIEIEPQLGLAKPLFVCDYPLPMGALARRKADDPTLTERFELYIGGLELCNGFSELTDPHEQRARFTAERRRRQAAGRADYPLPEPFLQDLARMPPAAGNAMGLDRLVMLFADADRIDAVVAFTPEEL